jgi:surfactin synthase thioesterase subunit
VTVVPGRRQGDPGTVCCFPGAGSFGREFGALAEARLVHYPGRQGRDFGTPAGSFDELVRCCAAQLPDRPLLVGHSFGAYVAYATALWLQDADLEVTALVVAGADAPGRLAVPDRATGTPAEITAYFDDVDPGMLAAAPSDEWREIAVETAREDLRLLRHFAGVDPVRCPIAAVRGAADPLTSDSTIGEWSAHTDGGYTRHVFPGGHSDFLRTPAFVSWLNGYRP